MSSQSPERIIRLTAVLERTGLNRSTLYRKMNKGTFPRQLKIADRCVGWHESAVKEWVKNQMLKRRRL